MVYRQASRRPEETSAPSNWPGIWRVLPSGYSQLRTPPSSSSSQPPQPLPTPPPQRGHRVEGRRRAFDRGGDSVPEPLLQIIHDSRLSSLVEYAERVTEDPPLSSRSRASPRDA